MSETKYQIADWEPTLRSVMTPATIEIPQGGYWQIAQVLAPPPPDWLDRQPGRPDPSTGRYLVDVEQWPDRGLVMIEADGAGDMVIGPDGKEITQAAGKIPPSICMFSVYSLRQAAWRLSHLEDNLHVGRAHRLLGWIEQEIRERGPSVPGLAALEEALQLARIAWLQYRTEVVAPVMQSLPFSVNAERRSRRITIRHVELLLGGGVDRPELSSIQVEIAAYVKASGPEFAVIR